METRTVMTLIVIIGQICAMAVIFYQRKENKRLKENIQIIEKIADGYWTAIEAQESIIRSQDNDIRMLKSENERQKQYIQMLESENERQKQYIQMLECDHKKSEEYSESAYREPTLSEQDDLILDYEEYVADHADEIIARSMGIEL